MIDKKNLKILIAEDNFLVMEMIIQSLNELGYKNIHEAQNGKVAVEKVSSLKPDVIFLDIEMPEMNGIEAMKIIQKKNPVPAIMLTAFENPTLIDEASKAGASAYLVKPLKKPLVERAISTALARHKDLMEVIRLNKELKKEVANRKLIEDELKVKNERLRIMNKIIRHDLSNDFSVIDSAVNIFKRRPDTNLLDEVIKRVNRSLDTIHSYKKYEAFIDSDNILSEIEVSDLINDLMPDFPKTKFRLSGKCKVLADEALNSVFINLISNAINHGNASEISISVTSNMTECKIIFKNNGTQIPEKIKEKIFNEGFYYGKSGHTGIGLYIVNKTIGRFNGSIKLTHNEANNVVFEITLSKVLSR